MKKITFLTLMFITMAVLAQPGPDDGTSFNGIDDFIIMPDSDNINTTPVSNRTVETYFKVNDATNRQVFYKEGAQVNTIKFYVEDGNLIVGSYRDNGGNNKSIWFRTPIQNNTWYHVALVLDDASRLLFYLDGQLQATNPNYFELPNHPGNFEIARTQGPARYPNCANWSANGNVEECLGDVTNTDNNVLFFGGSIWGFRIWDDVRTEDEININLNRIISDLESENGEGLLAFLIDNTMTYMDDDGNYDTEDLQGSSLSLEEFNQGELKVYLQNGNLVVDTFNSARPETLMLYDLLGKEVSRINNSSEMPVAQISKGVYILRISYQGQTTSKKVLITENR